MASEVELVDRELRRLKKGERIGTEADLVERLAVQWSRERAERAVRKALESANVPLRRTRRGVLVYEGTDQQIYDHVRMGLLSWLPMMGWSLDSAPMDCSSGARHLRFGEWSVPDLWFRTQPAKRCRQGRVPDLHVVEVEQPTGFGLPSVYQAFEHGRGANFTWVFGVVHDQSAMTLWRKVVRDGSMDAASRRTEARVWRAAQERNVGVVVMAATTQPSKWLLVNRPRRREALSTSGDRQVLEAILREAEAKDDGAVV